MSQQIETSSLEDNILSLYRNMIPEGQHWNVLTSSDLGYDFNVWTWTEQNAIDDYCKNITGVVDRERWLNFIALLEQLILSRYAESLTSPSVYVRKYAKLLKDKYLLQKVD